MTRAKRAIIMAAGYGSRMRPVTDAVPKPLIPVRGVRILDTQIAALHENGIYEIYVVTGHLRECFRGLEAQYPGVKVLHNPDYEKGNNITSMYYARACLDACVILDGDILIRNPKVLTPEYEHSTYCCTWFEDVHTEWIFRHDPDWAITEVLQEGGTGWGLRSISFWTREDACRLRDQVEMAYEEGLRDAYWDYIPVVAHRADYDLHIRPIPDEDILELDTFEELCQADPAYIP